MPLRSSTSSLRDDAGLSTFVGDCEASARYSAEGNCGGGGVGEGDRLRIARGARGGDFEAGGNRKVLPLVVSRCLRLRRSCRPVQVPTLGDGRYYETFFVPLVATK